MIFANPGILPRRPLPVEPEAEALAARAVWIDLLDPGEDECALVERATGLRVPTRAVLSEIERSSRLSAVGEVLTLSTPIVSRAAGDLPVVSPLGFVLTRDRLLTVRFEPMTAFDTYADRLCRPEARPAGGLAAFLGLLETIVDRLADVLEKVGADLDHLSHRVFRSEAVRVRRVRRESVVLQATLTAIGRAGDLVSSLRDSLVGISRIVAFVTETAAGWTPEALRPRLVTLRQDLASLNDYDAQIAGKVQFLLDATLGFINIQQNNVIKVLTVASIVGIPPTLVASIYGMNFKNIPELSWAWGYPYGLGVIALSAILPLLWFWWRGWL